MINMQNIIYHLTKKTGQNILQNYLITKDHKDNL